ncbi:MAG: leucine-rich repeat protein [Lachnospiraceae bacterium]
MAKSTPKRRTKKTMNRKLKRTIRKSLAAVLMMTAIIVAAIPVPDVAADPASGATPFAPLPGPAYPTTLTDIPMTPSLALPTGATVYPAYIIRQLSDGTWQLDWQFKFFITTMPDGSSKGVISKYNSTYQSPTVNLPTNVTYEYYKIPENSSDPGASGKTGYKDYYATENATKKEVTTKPGEGDSPFLEKYFNADYLNYVEAYKQYEIDHKAWEDAGKTGTEPQVPSLSKTVGELTDDQKSEYYCDADTGLTGKGYKMQRVLDVEATGASSTNIYSYVPRGAAGGSNDAQGFYKTKDSSIIAIGDKAFEGTKNVQVLTLPTEIKYIGDEAFMDSFIQSVMFANVENIGNRAFKGCSQLTKIDLQAGTSQIGTEAFYGSGVTEAILPYSVKVIAPGSFANCAKLQTVDLSKLGTDPCAIGAYAFFNDIGLNNVNFGDITNVNIREMGEGAFAVTTGVLGNMTQFNYPQGISEQANLGDYTLSGRTNLTQVVMPSNYGAGTAVTVPIGTFKDCVNLNSVEFPANGSGSCGLASYDATLFQDVINPDFYVKGPELDRTSAVAAPRKSTWAAKTRVSETVPYVYTKNGVDYYEVSDGKYLLQINANGELTHCDLIDKTSTEDINLTIPSKVGNIKVTAIADGCFADEVKNNLKTLTIADDSIASIADHVFQGCPKLEKVTIGNSVSAIGAGAFQGCKKLTEVTFHTPTAGLTIGEKAFETTSGSLTFCGDIVPGYAPFEWATDPKNVIDTKTSKRVCYKGSAPANLTVMRDNKTNLVTLVDYPFYENIDEDNKKYCEEQHKYYQTKFPTTYKNLSYSIQDKYYKQYIEGIQPVEDWDIVNEYELAIVEATRNLVVPAGIQSVDAKGFLLASENAANIFYIGGTFGTGKELKRDLYTKDDLTVGKDIHAGLFSGNYAEYVNAKSPEEKAKEKVIKGNDRLISVLLTDVTSLPDYAFDSCENLEKVTLGEKCTDVGTAPFTGCTKLTEVVGNSTYTGANGILYSKNADGSMNIVEGLSARGSDLLKPSTLNVDTDPLLAQVTTIAVGAFEDCDALTKVDLSAAAKLQTIPENCFHNADGITSVILPDSVNKIDKGAFTGTSKAPTVTIPGKEVLIDNDAFEHGQGTIRTYKGSAADKYGKKFNIDVEIIGDKYLVSFLDYDGKELCPDQHVESGKDATPPADPVRGGYKFDGWSQSYKNITKDTTIIAKYTATGSGFKVFFTDYDGRELCPVQVVDAGRNAVPPASPTRKGYTFDGWSKSYANITADTTIVAKYKSDGTNPGDNNGNNNNNNNNNKDNTRTYNVKVIGGSGSGSYKPGTIVSIHAFAVSDGRVFYMWSTPSNGVGFTGVQTASTTFTMPNNDVVVTANYGGPQTASSNNSVDNKPGNNNTISGNGGNNNGTNNGGNNSTNHNNTNGTVISITKPGFSNTNVASALVNGSTDNYIVKVMEDANAQAAMEAALLADNETLENIKYFPMDISLYDATGAVKITDTSGISIDITLPIPDELKQYAGNNKVATIAEDGSLEKLKPTFKTIDGVPCVLFPAPHLSPYAIYVDTANLTAGTTDDSPQTGDGIHPKWFLVLGLVCISGILFIKRDKTTGKIRTA